MQKYVCFPALVLLFVLFVYSDANATSSLYSAWARSAETLQVGRTYFSFQGNQKTSKSWLNSSGKKKPLGYQSRESIEVDNKTVLKFYQVKTNITELISTWGYGLTSRWSVGLQVPLISVSAKVSSRFYELGDSGELISLEKKKASDFFEPNPAFRPEPGARENGLYMGNIEIINKVKAYDDEDIIFSVYQGMRFPSAEKMPLDYYVSTYPAPMGFGFSVGSLANKKLNYYSSVSAHIKHTFNFKDKVERRNINTGQRGEELVGRNPGDVLDSSLLASFRVAEKASFMSGLNYEKKFLDLIDSESVLASESELVQLKVGFKFSGKDQGASVYHQMPVSGENVESSAATTVSFEAIF